MKEYCQIIREFEEIRDELQAVLERMSLWKLIGDELLPM